MRATRWMAVVVVLGALVSATQAQGTLRFKPVASVGVPGVAEIVDVSNDGSTLIYTNSASESVGLVDITDQNAPVFLYEIPVGGEPTSVSVHGDIAVVAVWVEKKQEGAPAPAFGNSKVVVFDMTAPTSPVLLGDIPVGYHPDSIKLTEIAGNLVAVLAIENEPVILDGGLVTDEDAPGNPNDVSPAGLIQVITVDTLNPAASLVVDMQLTPAIMAGLLYPTDPQPEFVDIHGTKAAVSLQENNGLAILSIANPANPVILNVFSLGQVSNRKADLIEDDTISLTQNYPGDAPMEEDGGGNLVAPGYRFPDGIAFSPDGQTIFTADEGELNFSGGRGFSVWKLNGQFRGDDGGEMERAAVQFSYYPDGRSENKGIEVEGVATATFGNKDYAFVISERGSFMGVYRIQNQNHRKLEQILPTGISPEGIIVIESRKLVVTADEGSGTISIFEGFSGLQGLPSVDRPQLYSNSYKKPFAALSGLCDAGFGFLHAIPDDAAPTQIFRINTGGPFAQVKPIRNVTLNGQQMRYDCEGICRDHSIRKTGPGYFPGGWWIAVEGNASSNPNLLVQVDFWGQVVREIQLPAAIDPAADPMIAGSAQGAAGGQQIRSNGFEGVTLSCDGRYLLACVQRDFANEFPMGPRYARIARYDLMQAAASGTGRIGGDWEFFFLELDSNDGDNWAGLSEISTIGPDQYMVIERDKGIALGSALKKIYAFDLSGLTPDADGLPDASDTVVKHEVADVLADFFPYEKVEGLALTNGGKLWVGLDNDGGEVESRLVNVGPFVNPLP
ncbi:MAG: esterase-like activity of phytase family protein [Planctomycetota bacterium]